ncbi:hypothetical protein EMPG_16933 [Blastomyces silverae]|uniref:Uncharacterized protein n=1 Tax=Blastomyces silverae TaxID=2060906 RepID=A0A0H1B859_9EURO|nr:hypothetical protein EMPG_16933 [Blastomyces silverae]
MKEMRGRRSLQKVQHVLGLLVWKLRKLLLRPLQASRKLGQSQEGNTENTSSGCTGHTHPHPRAPAYPVKGARSSVTVCRILG